MDPEVIVSDASLIYGPAVSLAVMLLSIGICWWALLCLKFERIVSTPGSPQAKLLHLILAVILGRQFGSFLLEYVHITALFGEAF
ncbi:DUF1146 domain-containing protein [Paenibacillus thermotolerans]|uniref:DUF1146 domain-containing protein n=1 Tax=Paenibacillus thermotolerans TaxID=3027807 RepID=UPI002368AA4D|nr:MULTISPECIES: DUF1146 domain-containing protein [unclassified Paenibacillus]